MLKVKTKIQQVIFLSLAILFSACAWADHLSGRVVSVSDGDTLTILDSWNTQHRIRLAEIDAPEVGKGSKKPGQPFGARSKQSLAELCLKHEATVEVLSTDRYGRSVGRVICSGVDANLEQVKKGMAWAYTQYCKRQEVFQAEYDAKQNRRGLWADPNSPIRPWEWRKN